MILVRGKTRDKGAITGLELVDRFGNSLVTDWHRAARSYEPTVMRCT